MNKKTEAKTIYQQVEEKSLPIITCFHDDLLKYDRRAIEADFPGTPFLHFTGDTGTHLVLLFAPGDYPRKDERVPYCFGTADREHILDGIVQMVRYMPRVNRQDLILYYAGNGRVQEIDQKRAEAIVEEYQRKITHLWRG